MSRLIRKNCLVLFSFPHGIYVLDICWNRLIEAILTNNQNICFFKILNTDNPLYTDTRYNNRVRYNDNYSVSRTSLKR